MTRLLLVWVFAAGLLATGPACRLFHRNESCGATRQAPPPCDGCPTSMKRSGSFVTPVSDGGVGAESFPVYPSSFGGPAYPVGEPVPLRSPLMSNTNTPANELPYPTLPNPNLPETPASARTTGDTRPGR